MGTGDFSAMTQAEIREQNRGITQQTRELAALTGALWAAVEARELWRDWGYPTFVEAVVREAPRAYSSVRECMSNYNYYVTTNHLTFGQFHQLVMQHGMRNLSDMRKAQAPDPPQLQLYMAPKGPQAVEQSPSNDRPPPIYSTVPSTSASSTGTGATVMSFPVKLYQWVTRRFRWNPEQDELAIAAIRHMQRRVKLGYHRVISDDEALALILGEYCSEKALRPANPPTKGTAEEAA